MGTSLHRSRRSIVLLFALSLLALACVATGPRDVALHGWWSGLGPVLPHDSFPADCRLCHVEDDWHNLREDFAFDHEGETGVPLIGAHAQAKCLRCHNDVGPVAVFAQRGCVGCHEDIHFGQLGQDCQACHLQETWQPVGQSALHDQTRFPLIGVHAATACYRCHPGAEIGQFIPTDTECVTCHQDDLARAINPNHVLLGLVDRCDRCHIPTTWDQAEVGASFPPSVTTGGVRDIPLRRLRRANR